MIIGCYQCKKKFEISSNLIPTDGRLLECSSCNYQWFYKREIEDEKILINPTEENISINPSDEKILINPTEENISINPSDEKKLINRKLQKKITDDISSINIEKIKRQNIESKKLKSKGNTKKIGFFNVILVFIISFVALILIMETFKIQIAPLLPDVQFILDNLYISIQDVYLFLKDLF